MIFDCDGVLVSSERLVCRIEATLLSRWGWQVGEQELRRRFKGKSFLRIAEEVERQLGPALPADWMYQWAMETANGFRRHLSEVPGVRAVVEAVVASGRPTCVASQSPQARAELSLGVCDLERYFGGRVYTSSMVARPKPAPDLFLFAAAQLGVQAEQCVVIEDSPSGVRGAIAAGMRVLGYAADEDAAALESAGAEVFHDMTHAPHLLGL